MLILNVLPTHLVLVDIIPYGCEKAMVYNPSICVTQKRIGSLLNLVPLSISFLCSLREFFLLCSLGTYTQISVKLL